MAPEEQPPPTEKPQALTFAPDQRYDRIDAVARQEIAAEGLPGAVILVGHQGKIVYRKAFGYRSLVPQRYPMSEDTIFDLASLTKVVATTNAVMQLVDAGLVDLNAPVAKYLPEFNSNGKSRITIKELMTHCLRAAPRSQLPGRLDRVRRRHLGHCRRSSHLPAGDHV